MADNPSIPVSSSMSQPQRYMQQAPLLQVMDYLLSNPSIPLSLRQQYYMLWENVTFGNYDEKDILRLRSKFREWCILLMWFIPEQQWGNIQRFVSDDGGSQLRMDLNLLLNSLDQMYYIQLTRGKDGFTVRELNTLRTKNTIATEEEKEGKKRVVRLF